jgi:hypothetical protein
MGKPISHMGCETNTNFFSVHLQSETFGLENGAGNIYFPSQGHNPSQHKPINYPLTSWIPITVTIDPSYSGVLHSVNVKVKTIEARPLLAGTLKCISLHGAFRQPEP